MLSSALLPCLQPRGERGSWIQSGSPVVTASSLQRARFFLLSGTKEREMSGGPGGLWPCDPPSLYLLVHCWVIIKNSGISFLKIVLCSSHDKKINLKYTDYYMDLYIYMKSLLNEGTRGYTKFLYWRLFHTGSYTGAIYINISTAGSIKMDEIWNHIL